MNRKVVRWNVPIVCHSLPVVFTYTRFVCCTFWITFCYSHTKSKRKIKVSSKTKLLNEKYFFPNRFAPWFPTLYISCSSNPPRACLHQVTDKHGTILSCHSLTSVNNGMRLICFIVNNAAGSFKVSHYKWLCLTDYPIIFFNM